MHTLNYKTIMRRILLSLVLVSFALVGTAQTNSFYYPFGTTVDEAGMAGGNFSSTLKFKKNQAGDPVTFMWRVLSVDTIESSPGATANFGLCDNVSCYTNFLNNDFTMTEVSGSSYGTFKLQGFAFTGEVKVAMCVRVWDQSTGVSDTLCLSWRTDNWVTIDEHKVASEISVYPNPATNFLNVSYNLGSGTSGTFELVSLVGSTVYKKELTEKDSKFNLNIEKLPKGVYFYSIKDNKGKVLTTRKLVVR